MKENEEEKEAIHIEFSEQIVGPENNQNAFDFKRSDVQKEDEEDIALAH